MGSLACETRPWQVLHKLFPSPKSCACAALESLFAAFDLGDALTAVDGLPALVTRLALPAETFACSTFLLPLSSCLWFVCFGGCLLSFDCFLFLRLRHFCRFGSGHVSSCWSPGKLALFLTHEHAHYIWPLTFDPTTTMFNEHFTLWVNLSFVAVCVKLCGKVQTSNLPKYSHINHSCTSLQKRNNQVATI